MSKTTLRKGKQDDKFSLAIRDIQAMEPANKKCFDCSQRGPTYINTTIGSFVCTKCSGMLRGINPPHRIKSISMSSFSADEVEMMRSKGNSYCAAVWLGLYDAGPIDYKDEEKIKEFIIAKYEKKRYYVEPSIASISKAAAGGGSPGPEPNTQPSSRSGLASASLIGSTLKARMEPSSQVNISVSRPGQRPPESATSIRPSNGLPPRPNLIQASQSQVQPPTQPALPGQPRPSTQHHSATEQQQQQVTGPAPGSGMGAGASGGGIQGPAPPSAGVQGVQAATDFGNFADFSSAAFDSIPADPLTAPTSNPCPGLGPSRPPAEPPKAPQDKYSALAELDDLFKSSAIQGTESVFPEVGAGPPLFQEPALPLPTGDLFQSLLDTGGAPALGSSGAPALGSSGAGPGRGQGSPALPQVFGQGLERSVNGSPGGWAGAGRISPNRWGGSQWTEGSSTWSTSEAPLQSNALVAPQHSSSSALSAPHLSSSSALPLAAGHSTNQHSTNPFGTSPSAHPGLPHQGLLHYTPDNNNDLFAAAPKPFFAEKSGVETNPWTGAPVPAFTADMKPAHNPNNPFL